MPLIDKKGNHVFKKIFFTPFFLLSCCLVYASERVENPWFVGGVLGGGSTTWKGLVPETSKQNAAINLSTPIDVQEGGFVWGIAAGVEAFKNFQLQFDYMDYPDATINFDPDSIYSIDHDGATSLKSSTYSWSIQGKFLVPWRDTNLKPFASGGVAWIARRDELLQENLVSPVFGIGLNYTFTKNIMAEVAFTYTSGYGQSELSPADDYIPFLYAVFGRVYLRLG